MVKTPEPGFPPCLQDGTATTFPETVRLIARYQYSRQPASENISSIVEYMDLLAGEAGRVGRGFSPAVELPLDEEFPEYSGTSSLSLVQDR